MYYFINITVLSLLIICLFFINLINVDKLICKLDNFLKDTKICIFTSHFYATKICAYDILEGKNLNETCLIYNLIFEFYIRAIYVISYYFYSYHLSKKYIATHSDSWHTISGIDGHSCLLRSICEVAVAPEHEDGVMGDIVNTLLTVSNTMNSITHVKGTEDVYGEAQAIGQVEWIVFFPTKKFY